jgi:DNA-binding XRE family transcriptional regulator
MRWNRQSTLIREARFLCGYTQSHVAACIGNVSNQNVFNVENNRSGVPLRHIYNYCKVLSIDKDAMITSMTLDHADYLERKYIEGFVREPEIRC